MNSYFYHKLGIFLVLAYFFTSINVLAETTLNGKVIDVSINKKMLTNKRYSAKVTVKNTGVTTWTRSSGITLAATSKTNDLWKIPYTQLSTGEKIRPGETRKFKVPIKALSRTGIFSLQFELQNNRVSFGEKSDTLNIIVETRSNRVKFISQLLPNTMDSEEEYPVVVQFKNNGTSTWGASGGYKLRLISNKKVWGINQIKMSKKEIVPPGEIATFRFKLKAPKKLGNYPIQWQMQRGRHFFGEPTPVQKIEVSQNKKNMSAEFIYQDIPMLNKSGNLFAVLDTGAVYPVTITFKNNSDKTWREGLIALNSQGPEKNNMVWSVDRIDLNHNESIPPGGIKTFNFKIITPLSPGIYHFQWQMIEGFNQWIGERSEVVTITVK